MSARPTITAVGPQSQATGSTHPDLLNHSLRAPTLGRQRRLMPPSSDLTQDAIPSGRQANRLPLYHRPGAVVLVDDDAEFLEVLEFNLPKAWNVQTFTSPVACLRHLLEEPVRWEADYRAQQKIIELWHSEEMPLIPQVLQYWALNHARYQLTKVCVSAYLMPAMDGMEMLSKLGDWPGQRVLLTGSDSDNVAMAAFNEDLIDRFISKKDPALTAQLLAAVGSLLHKPNERFHQIWSATLSAEQTALLQSPSIAEDLRAFAEKKWVEWVVIGEPFGILGLDRAGNASWLQLEPTAELGTLAEMAKEHGATESERTDILNGQCLSDIELQLAFGARWPATVRPALSVDAQGMLVAAMRELPTSAVGAAMMSYAAWLAQNSPTRAGNQSRF